MLNGEHGVGEINFAGLMQELEKLGVDLPAPRRLGMTVSVKEQGTNPFRGRTPGGVRSVL